MHTVVLPHVNFYLGRKVNTAVVVIVVKEKKKKNHIVWHGNLLTWNLLTISSGYIAWETSTIFVKSVFIWMCICIYCTSELTPENLLFCIPPMPVPVSEAGGFLAAYFLNTLLKLKDAISVPSILIFFYQKLQTNTSTHFKLLKYLEHMKYIILIHPK